MGSYLISIIRIMIIIGAYSLTPVDSTRTQVKIILIKKNQCLSPARNITNLNATVYHRLRSRHPFQLIGRTRLVLTLAVV